MNTTTRLIELLPALTHGNRLSVYAAILSMSDSVGVSINDVMDSTTLSRPTVSNAVRFLTRIELVEENAGRYHALANIFDAIKIALMREPSQLSREQTALLGKRPISDVKNIFTSNHDDDLVQELVPVELNHHHHDCAEIEKIFTSVGFQGKNLILLSKSVSRENARAWAEWIKSEPSGVKNPSAYAWACLRDDPQAVPPKTKSKSARWYDDCNEFVNR